MIKEKTNFFVLLLLLVTTVIFFRQFFFQGQVPFSANLLVSFYSPWKFFVYKDYPNGPANKPIGFDNLKLFYPYRTFTQAEIKAGHWPLWNPFNFAGNVHLATYQAAVFYPFNLIYFFCSQITAWSLLVVIQPVLAGFFTYLFLRALNLKKVAAFFGAVVFAFSGWMLAWSEESLVIEHAALWLPLMLLASEKILQKKTNWFWGLVLAIVMSILAGFLQMTIYALVTVLLWTVWRLLPVLRKNFRTVFIIVAALLSSFLLTSLVLFPALESYFLSPRGVVGVSFLFKSYLMPPWHLITLLVPDFWGNPGFYNYFGGGFFHEKVIFFGIPGLLLALYSFFIRPATRSLVFWRALAVGAFALGFFPFGWLLYFSHLPLFSSMIPSRIFFLATFAAAVLSALGLDQFLREEFRSKVWRNILALLLAILALAGLFVFLKILTDPLGDYARFTPRNLILPVFFLLASTAAVYLAKIKKNAVWLAAFCLTGLSLLSSLYFGYKILYFSDRDFVFPEVTALTKLKEVAGLNRVWGYGQAYLEKNMTIQYGLYSPEGYDALYSQRYGELLHTQETGGRLTAQILRTDADLKQAAEHEPIFDSWYRRRLLSLLGVKYILQKKLLPEKEGIPTAVKFPPEFFHLVWEDDQFRIWENQEALPRAFVVYQSAVFANDEQIIASLFSPEFLPGEKVILEKTVPLSPERLSTSTPAVITSYESNEVVITGRAVSQGVLFLSDNFYPGWEAFVNGQKAEILRADYAFRAVAVPAGDFQVRFVYRPFSFRLGLAVTVISLLILPLLYWLGRRKGYV